jgi:hypothetical protein
MGPAPDRTAEAAAERLQEVDEEELYRLLAMRVRAMERNPAVAGEFDPDVPPEVGVSFVDLAAIGRRTFERLSVPGHQLLCGSTPAGGQLERLLSVVNTNAATVTAALATLLVGQLAIAPAVAGIVAAIVVGKVAPGSMSALCQAWQSRLPATTDGPATT